MSFLGKLPEKLTVLMVKELLFSHLIGYDLLIFPGQRIPSEGKLQSSQQMLKAVGCVLHENKFVQHSD